MFFVFFCTSILHLNVYFVTLVLLLLHVMELYFLIAVGHMTYQV